MKALVLSAGGSFGAYQIGAWRALEENGWSPDLIVGASIGAVNGFAISRGASASDLLRMWRDEPLAVQQRARAEGRRTPSRVSLAKHTDLFCSWIEQVFEQWSESPRRHDLLVTMTAWPSCALREVRDREVECAHLIASCAVPAVMPPARIGGRVYIDGGTFCPLPLRAALRAGATEIVAVDVLAAPPCKAIRWARIAGTSLRNFVRRESTEPSREELARARLYRVQPCGRLGDLEACFAWDPRRIDALAEAGYRAAEASLGSSSRRRQEVACAKPLPAQRAFPPAGEHRESGAAIPSK
jgi:NTE family protein